jgi:hypothetical protein
MYKKGKFLFTTDDMILSKNDKLLVISMKSKVSMLRKMK